MSCWGDEKQAAVNTRVLNEPGPLRRKLTAEIRRVLVFDILDYRIPAPIIVDLITVSWCIDDVQPEVYSVLFDTMTDSRYLCRSADGFLWIRSSFRVDQVGCKESIDKRALSQSSLTYKGDEHKT